MTRRNTFIFFLALFMPFILISQEICDNGIDDDNDGLIDLNDNDCYCETFISSSLIPNPSFEEMTCCPTKNEMLNCAVGWTQASAPTTDYVHTCEGYIGNTNIPAFAPLPFPDGEGAVGFRDGQKNAGSNYKEYVGACLTEKMEIGKVYRFDFFVGFRDNVDGNKNFNMAIFGSTSCDNLPFGNGSASIGCPANTGLYDNLAQINVSGSNEWVNVVLEFTASKEYEVIVLGPDCAANPNYKQNPYFYVDRLALQEVAEFGFPLEETMGSICENNLILSVTDDPTKTYQWYKEGVAIMGETGSSINLKSTTPGVEGIYLVVIIAAEGCMLSREYEVRIPPYYAPLTTQICDDELFIVGTDTMNTSGYYEITILADDGCDSIVQLSLDVAASTYGMAQDTFCEGDIFQFYDIETTEPGFYFTTILNAAGCDSLLDLELIEIPAGPGVQFPSPYEPDLGEVFNIIPISVDPKLITFTWRNMEGDIISEELNLYDFLAVNSTSLFLEALDQYGCGVVQEVVIRVNKDNIKIYIPNIFTPDGNNLNDFFKFYPTIALDRVERFAIYDRWGNKVFDEIEIEDANDFVGWDGQFKGRDAMQGVYAYYLHAVFVDGSEKIIAGDITLIR